MQYLAIAQHKNHLTINIRNEQGDVVQKGQVSTNHTDIDEFFTTFAKKARKHRGYMAIVEVCGFNDWLLEKLKKTRCSEIVVIQPDNPAVNKTDKRDADALGTLLWNNRKPYQFRYDPPVVASKKKDDLRSSGKVLGGIGNRNHSRKKEGTPLKCRGKTKA